MRLTSFVQNYLIFTRRSVYISLAVHYYFVFCCSNFYLLLFQCSSRDNPNCIIAEFISKKKKFISCVIDYMLSIFLEIKRDKVVMTICFSCNDPRFPSWTFRALQFAAITQVKFGYHNWKFFLSISSIINWPNSPHFTEIIWQWTLFYHSFSKNVYGFYFINNIDRLSLAVLAIILIIFKAAFILCNFWHFVCNNLARFRVDQRRCFVSPTYTFVS